MRACSAQKIVEQKRTAGDVEQKLASLFQKAELAQKTNEQLEARISTLRAKSQTPAAHPVSFRYKYTTEDLVLLEQFQEKKTQLLVKSVQKIQAHRLSSGFLALSSQAQARHAEQAFYDGLAAELRLSSSPDLKERIKRQLKSAAASPRREKGQGAERGPANDENRNGGNKNEGPAPDGKRSFELEREHIKISVVNFFKQINKNPKETKVLVDILASNLGLSEAEKGGLRETCEKICAKKSWFK